MDILARIEKRRQQLYKVGKDLKKHFVGIDEPIDKLLFNIEAWWCMPELMTRPTIVCLWGLTGVGKTDLIRKLIQGLNMVDSYLEIQMTNKGSASHYSNTLQGVFTGSNLLEEEPGILLLDEMQRFRSVNQHGEEIEDYSFQDIWMLLSDGSFGSTGNNKESLLEFVFDDMYWTDYDKAEKTVDGKGKESKDDKRSRDIQEKRTFKRTYWSAMRIKRQFRLQEPAEEIMKWDSKKKLEVLYSKLEDKSIYRAESYPQLLVLIAGNLDEAYKMSQETNETDVNADLFHKHSKKINLVNVKGVLRQRFKPEQIARFGNSHIIYPALNKKSYQKIIKRKVDKVVKSYKKHSGVSFNIDKSVLDAIYRNGVFPAQGTRPVFSTISCFFECTLPQFVYQCVKEGKSKVTLYYEDKHLCCDLPSGTFRIKNEGDIDRIKSKKRNKDKIFKVAVHEAGHALVYAKLFGVMPTQIAVNLASDNSNGFIGIHNIENTKKMNLDQITCIMAGRCAEELVFGKNNIGAGAEGDIAQATSIASALVRIWGMGNRISRHQLPSNGADDANRCNTDIEHSNETIEELMQSQKDLAQTILAENKPLLIKLANYLVKNDKIEKDAFISMFKKHGIKVSYLDAKDTLYPPYQRIYKEAKKNLTKVADKKTTI